MNGDRNLVATFAVGAPWYATHTVPFMKRYADDVGAAFVEHRHFPGGRDYGRVAAWLRLEALRAFAEQETYDRLLLLDADVVVLPGCPDVFPRIGERVLAVEDMGMPAVTPRYVEWCVRHLAERPNHLRYFNAGVLGISRSTARRLVPLLDGPFPEEAYYEQDYLNLRVQNRIGVEFLPATFNWLAPQFVQASLTKNIVHFVGGYKRFLPEFVSLLDPVSLPDRTDSGSD